MASQPAHEEEVLGKAYDSRLMKRLLTYLSPYKYWVLLVLLALLVKSAVDVAGPYLTKVAIDKYLAHSLRPDSWLEKWLARDALTGIAEIALLSIAALTGSFLLEFLQTYFMQSIGQKVMFDMRAQIFRHLQSMHVGFFDKNPVGRLVTRVTTDVDALNDMFTSGVVSIFGDAFALVVLIGVMLAIDWRLALTVFSVLPGIVAATILFRNAVRNSYRRIRTAIARINAYLQEHVSGMVVVQLFNREQRSYEEFEQVNRSHMEAFKDAILAHAYYYPVVEILSTIAIALVVWYGGGQVLHNAARLGTLAAFMQYAVRFFHPIMDLSEKYNILQSAMASSERVFKLLDTAPEIVSPSHPISPTTSGEIEFDHVWFAYQNRPAADSSAGAGGDGEPEWVLRDVSFTVKPGQTVAVVGHTGAGKTTLVSLLLRFYDIQRGTIRVDGVDIRDLDLSALRSRFGVVLQDPFLFSGTIEDNIKLGTDWIQKERVEAAAEEVNIADFIRSLPGGFQEMMRERGSTLSTGQKQLISFARALAHNPKILILDEATSSVDTETEFRVRDALGRMVEGRTSLIIAHRLSTIQRADTIIVMHRGKVREMGSHQELLSRRGIYWKLYQLQYKDQEIVFPGLPAPSVPEVAASD